MPGRGRGLTKAVGSPVLTVRLSLLIVRMSQSLSFAFARREVSWEEGRDLGEVVWVQAFTQVESSRGPSDPGSMDVNSRDRRNEIWIPKICLICLLHLG